MTNLEKINGPEVVPDLDTVRAQNMAQQDLRDAERKRLLAAEASDSGLITTDQARKVSAQAIRNSGQVPEVRV